MNAQMPWRDDGATTPCRMCQRPFVPSGRARYCCDGCRKAAWRRRHRPPPAPIVVPAPGQPRRPVTVYECATCGTRALGVQRCETCGAFSGRVGLGALCPHCYEPVAVVDLLDQGLAMVPFAPGAEGKAPRQTATTRPRRSSGVGRPATGRQP